MIFNDERVLNLYLLARNSEEPMINEVKREAVQYLGEMAKGQNDEAVDALRMLFRVPGLHPLLKEMVAAELGIRPQAC
jgi:hypothetical protein